MKTIQELYKKHISGEVTKSKFLYEARRDVNLSQFITNLTSYDDCIRILRNRGILTEAKKIVNELTLDTANPYEYRKGLDYELDLCYKATPKFLAPDLFEKAQTTVLKNLAKDPNYYSKCLANVEPTKSPDLASEADFGGKSKRSDVSIPVKKENFNDKKNAWKIVEKDEKSNVKDTLGNKEKAKAKSLKENTEQKSSSPKKQLNGSMSPFQKGRPTTLNQNIALEENIPASSAEMLPFGNVQAGMKAIDDSGEEFKILAKGNYNNLKRYDSSKVFDKFLSSDPSGVDATQLVALIDKDGNTFVRVYGTGGVYAYGDNPNVNEENDDLKNKRKAYIQAKIKADQEELNSIREKINMKESMQLTNIVKGFQALREADPDFEAQIGNKEIPQNETEQAEAKAIILPTITKANLHQNFDLDADVAIKNGYIWVKVRLGHGILSKEQMKALTSDSKFEGANPVTDTEITLIFSKA